MQYNEENKSATMKIDEPPTPYLPPIDMDAVIAEDEASISPEYKEEVRTQVRLLIDCEKD